MISKARPCSAPTADDAVLVRLLRRDFLDREDVAADFVVGLDALGEAAAAVRAGLRHHVGQQDRERLVADDVARAPHRMAEAERRLLAGEAGRAGRRKVGHQRRVGAVLAAPLQRVLEFVGRIEMVLDDALVAAGDEDEMLDARLARLVDDVLQDRPVDDGQHFLRHGLGGRQKAGAEARDGENRFSDRFVHGFSVPWDAAEPALSGCGPN